MFDVIPWWWRVKRLSWREIQKMRANMAKVPIIKKKSDTYHDIESQQADELLNKFMIQEDSQKTQSRT